MTATSLTYVVPIDFTSTTENALKFTLEMASNHQVKIVLLHIIDDHKQKALATQQMLKLIDENKNDKTELEFRIVTGKVLSDIGIIAESIGANLIVMGTHNATMFTKIFGSRALEVTKNSKIPLILLQEGASYGRIKTMALTIDLHRESTQVVKAALPICKLFDAELMLVGQRFDDESFMAKIQVNLRISHDYLLNNGVESEIVLLPEKRYTANLIQFCKEKHIDLLAVTYYEDNFRIFSDNLVHTLSQNHMKIPVLTFDGEDVASGSQFGFITQ